MSNVTAKTHEAAFIGSILMFPECREKALSLIQPHDFTNSINAAIFQAFVTLGPGAEYPDIIDELQKVNFIKGNGDLERIGEHVQRVTDGIGTSAGIERTAAKIREATQRRALIEIGRELQAGGRDLNYEIPEVVAACLPKITGLQDEAPKRLFPPLTFEQTQVNGRLTSPPPEARPLLLYNGEPVLSRGIVGGFIGSGGVGKTTMLLQIAYSMAAGAGFGPLRADANLRVLMLLAEDVQEESDRRLWRMNKGVFPVGLCVASIAGRLPPIMCLVDGNPQRSPSYDWLRATIQNHMPLDVLILDPKSRFYGLDENNNDHATQWIACLEALAVEYDLTVLFSHHASKQRADTMGQSASRGASAIVDGCRWVAGITKLAEESARRYGIPDPRNYIEFDITKSNYAAQLPSRFIFRRTENGLLEYAALEAERRQAVKKLFYWAVRSHNNTFSRRDLIKNVNGAAEILSDIEEEYPSFKRTKEIDSLVNELTHDGLMEEVVLKTEGARKPKMVLQAIPVDPENVQQKWI